MANENVFWNASFMEKSIKDWKIATATRIYYISAGNNSWNYDDGSL